MKATSPQQSNLVLGSLGIRQPKGFQGLPSGWVSEWETFAASSGGLNLFGAYHHRQLLDREQRHRLLVILHGMGEHGGRYLHAPHFLQSKVDGVYCVDHRGHGRSEGIRGHVEKFDELAEDGALLVRRLNEQLLKKFGKSEIHLFGHSLGGHIALRMLFLTPDLPLCSATVSAPFLGIKARVPTVKKLAAIGLSRVWGSLQLDTELDVNTLSHDPEVIDAYLHDRLVHSKMTPRFFTEMLAAMDDTLSRETGIELPLQMAVPLQDGLVDAEKSLRFFRQLKHRDKQLKTYPTFFHEPVNEIGKEQVFDDIGSWIEAHSL